VPSRRPLESRVDSERSEPVRVPRLVHRLQERKLCRRRGRLRLSAEKREGENNHNSCEYSPGHECGAI